MVNHQSHITDMNFNILYDNKVYSVHVFGLDCKAQVFEINALNEVRIANKDVPSEVMVHIVRARKFMKNV